MTAPQQQTQPPNRGVQAAVVATPIVTAYAFRRAQDAALTPVLKRVRQLFHVQGVPVTDGQRQAMALSLLRPMRNARATTYEATVRYLGGQGFHEPVPPLIDYPLETLTGELERNVSRIVVGGEPVTEHNRTEGQFIEAARKSASGTVSRHVQAPARETVKNLADNSGPIIGWARVLTGPSSCSFCAMLASRGPVYTRRETAIGRGGNPLNLYHSAHLNKNGKLVGGNCDCIAVPVRVGVPWPGEDAYIELENLWQKSTKRTSNDAARNAFRSVWDQKVRAGETGDFVSASVKPPGGA